MAGDIYIARTGAVLNLDGQVTYITPGMTARAGHKILSQAGGLFEPLRVDFEVAQPEEKAPVPALPAPAEYAKPAPAADASPPVRKGR